MGRHGRVLRPLAPAGEVHPFVTLGQEPQVLLDVVDRPVGTAEVAAALIATAPATVWREDCIVRLRADGLGEGPLPQRVAHPAVQDDHDILGLLGSPEAVVDVVAVGHGLDG